MYATIADLIAKYGEANLAKITNEDLNDNIPDPDRLECALEEATAEVDMYLGKCYPTPLTVVPDIIKFKTLVLARYFLESGCECSEKLQKKYEDAIELLHSLCCGDCPPDIGIPKKSDRVDSIAFCARPRVFTPCTLRSYTEIHPYGHSSSDRNYKY